MAHGGTSGANGPARLETTGELDPVSRPSPIPLPLGSGHVTDGSGPSGVPGMFVQNRTGARRTGLRGELPPLPTV